MDEALTVTELFIHIHDKVGATWENKIIKSIPKDIIAKSTVVRNGKSSTVFRIGFFPISLSLNSGMKISQLSDSEQRLSDNQQLYIVDPELKYINSKTQKPFSITRVLDKIFNAFRKMIDEKLKGLFGLRLFLKGLWVVVNLEFVLILVLKILNHSSIVLLIRIQLLF